jgi:hypothetical protein
MLIKATTNLSFAVFVLTTILAVKVPFSSSWTEAFILTLFSAAWFMWNLCQYVETRFVPSERRDGQHAASAQG